LPITVVTVTLATRSFATCFPFLEAVHATRWQAGHAGRDQRDVVDQQSFSKQQLRDLRTGLKLLFNGRQFARSRGGDDKVSIKYCQRYDRSPAKSDIWEARN
jgi:hypothetical protein